jgi:hypothetical protein
MPTERKNIRQTDKTTIDVSLRIASSGISTRVVSDIHLYLNKLITNGNTLNWYQKGFAS